MSASRPFVQYPDPSDVRFGDPLRPPQPRGYGFIADQQLPEMPDYAHQQPTNVSRSDLEQLVQPSANVPMPDIVRVQFGKGDKDIVGALLRTAAGDDSALVGVSPTYAADLLTKWGYPTTMDALDDQGWAALIGQNAATDPFAVLSQMGTGFGTPGQGGS